VERASGLLECVGAAVCILSGLRVLEAELSSLHCSRVLPRVLGRVGSLVLVTLPDFGVVGNDLHVCLPLLLRVLVRLGCHGLLLGVAVLAFLV